MSLVDFVCICYTPVIPAYCAIFLLVFPYLEEVDSTLIKTTNTVITRYVLAYFHRVM